MNTKTKAKRFRELLWVFTIIYFTDTLLFATNSSVFFKSAPRFGGILLMIIAIMTQEKNGQKIDATVDKKHLLVTASAFCSMILSRTDGYYYITFIVLIWFGYFFAKKMSLEEFAKYYCRIMRVIAITSLICFFLGTAINAIPAIPVITNTKGVMYKFLLFTCVPMKGSLIHRNMGPFWEPGTYQVYLNVALMFTLFFSKGKMKIFDCILFIATALTTLSGAALLPMIIIMMAYTFEHKHIGNFVFVSILAVTLIVLMNTGMFDEITEKIGQESETNSFTYRWIGIRGAIDGFLHNPIFGSPPEVLDEIRSGYARDLLGKDYGSNANTYLNFFAYYGFFVGAYMCVNTYKMFDGFVRSKVALILVCAAYFLATSNENLTSSILILTLVFMRCSPEKTQEIKGRPIRSSSSGENVRKKLVF